MDLQTRCLEYLEQEGFSPNVTEVGIFFKYQMRDMLIRKHDDDEYFDIMLPAIYDVNPSNREECLAMANEITTHVKAVKALVLDDTIHLSIGLFVGPTPNFADFVPCCLDALVAAYQMFVDLIRQDLPTRESTKKATGWRSFFKRTDN